MIPYYEDESAVLYHGDCRDVLPSIPAVDLLLTDPPYGINYEPTRRANGSKMWGTSRVEGDHRAFDPTPLLAFPRAVIFGANHFADMLPPSGGWLVWDKTPDRGRGGFIASDAELAWTNLSSLVTTFRLQWGGRTRNGEGHFHPTQKPVALLRWVIEKWSSPNDLIVDPYAGSASTLVAAKLSGRKSVGVEIEERYCEIAAWRLSQSVLDFESTT